MNRTASLPSGLLLFAAATLPIVPAWSTVTVTSRKIALTGEHPPGTPAGVTFSDFGTPTLSDDGRAAFQATLTTGGTVTSSNNSGSWLGTPDSLTLLLRKGDPAPGVSGATFRSVGIPWVDSTGRVTFKGFLTGGGVTIDQNDTGIWNGLPGSIALIARQKGTAAGISSAIYDSISNYQVGRSGVIGYTCQLSGAGIDSSGGATDNSRGVWIATPGNTPGLARRSGQSAPGTGTTFTAVEVGKILASGSACILGTFFNPAVHDSGVYVGPVNALQLLGRENTPAPDCPANWISRGITTPAFNDTGVFYCASAALVNGNVNDSRQLLYYSSGDSNLKLIAKTGDSIPGSAGTIIDLSAMAADNQGNGLGLARVIGDTTKDTCILRLTPSGFTPLIHEGDQAPGQPVGVVFGDLRGNYATNLRGECVFQNQLTGAGVTSDNANSIWHISAAGEITLLARRGSPFQVAAGDTRTVRGIFVSSSPSAGDFKPPSFNDAGQVAVNLTFSDSSAGVFLITAVSSAPAAPLRIASITRSASAVNLTIPVASGQTIGVEYSETLTPAAWSDLGNVTVSGSNGTFSDTNSTRLAKKTGFYRAFSR